MTSLITGKTLGKDYNVYSLSVVSGHEPENVLVDDDKSYFQSAGSPSNQWWQISFTSPVSISSYIIRTGSSFSARPQDWTAAASSDNTTWKTVDTRTGIETGNNKNQFTLSKVANYKHFRLVLVKATSYQNDDTFGFTFFDCFGSSYVKSKRVHSCNVSYLKYKLFLDVLIVSFSSIIM